MTLNLFPDFAETIRNLSDSEVADPRTVGRLRLDSRTVGTKKIELFYAPFDHVNASARLVLVGLTPGLRQASDALLAARASLRAGEPFEVALEQAKVFASFSGEVRPSLVRLLDYVRINELLGLGTTAELWKSAAGLVHFTSAIRYPLFVDGGNWSGRPRLLGNPEVRQWLDRFTGEELKQLGQAMLVPLGDTASDALDYLTREGVISRSRILGGLPHPSTLNRERIHCFLGLKAPELCSSRTDPEAILLRRDRLMRQVAALLREGSGGR